MHTKYHLEVHLMKTDNADDGKILDIVEYQTSLTGEWNKLEDAQKAVKKIVRETNTLYPSSLTSADEERLGLQKF